MKSDFKTLLILGVVTILLIGILAIFSPFANEPHTPMDSKNIMTDKPFEATGNTSKYTCIITEIDNDLVLNCLRAE
jgi:hypothetical protein